MARVWTLAEVEALGPMTLERAVSLGLGAFVMRCTCSRRTHRFEVTLSNGDVIEQAMCLVCSAQSDALGLSTRLLGAER